MFVAVLQFNQENSKNVGYVSYAFTGEKQSEVIQRMLAYQKCHSLTVGYETLVGELDQKVVSPVIEYRVVPI